MVVAIISDGRKKIHPRVLDCLAALGVYQDGVAKTWSTAKRCRRICTSTRRNSRSTTNLQFKGAERGLVPMQIIFCLKEKNAKKINSHRWFFNAFCPILQPNVTILLDVGTRPENKSIYYLWKSFDLNSNVAGACGEICAETKGKWGVGPLLLNPLVAAQNFEYKISNILDKTTESVMATSRATRCVFGVPLHRTAERRIRSRSAASTSKARNLLGADAMCLRPTCTSLKTVSCASSWRPRGKWVGVEVRQVRTWRHDVPEGLPEFISQRRRWLNGSFFAASMRSTTPPSLEERT